MHSWRREFTDERGRIHGIVIAKSYECKPYGIQTGTHLSDALAMCPDLVVVSSDHLFYQLLSHKLKEYLHTKIPVLEQYSIDEFFGDVGGWIRDEDVPTFIKTLQSEILEIFDLPITITASKSKWVAKLATDRHKPFGTKVIFEDEVASYLRDIPVSEFAGVGKNTLKKLDSVGCKRIGEVADFQGIFYSWGKSGRDLYARMLGEDNEPVVAYHDRKSIGISRRFPTVSNRDEIDRRVGVLARHLAYTISKLDLKPTTYYFKLRYESGFSEKISSTNNRLFSERFFIDLATQSFRDLDRNKHCGVGQIAMSLSNFANPSSLKTHDILNINNDTKQRSLDSAMTKLRDRYGIDTLRWAGELNID